MTVEAQEPAEDPGDRPPRILVVDDEADILDSLKDLLDSSLENVVVRTALSGQEGLEILAKESVDLIITDYKMPSMNGLEFLEKSTAIEPNVPRILVTAFPDLDIAIRAINDAGINNFFTKPFEPSKVVDVVAQVLRERKHATMRSKSFARSLDVLRRQINKGPKAE